MKTTGNTVLISGGTAGIGLEIARSLTEKGNKIVITGRNKERLDKAIAQLPNAVGIVSDVSKADAVETLIKTLTKDYPDLNMIINNAGRAEVYDLATEENIYDIAEDEMNTNYLSIIRLNEKLQPLLSAQNEAYIVNVSSVVAIVPGSLATYSASKAALHSYTQSLRLSLAKVGNIKVFELMPPLVDTEFSAPIGGHKGIKPSVVADEFLAGLESDTYEIHVGNTQYIYDLYLKSPAEALAALNGGR